MIIHINPIERATLPTVASKFESDWEFLCMLRDRGRAEATRWLVQNYDAIGERSSIDLGAEFLDSGAEQEDGALAEPS